MWGKKRDAGSRLFYPAAIDTNHNRRHQYKYCDVVKHVTPPCTIVRPRRGSTRRVLFPKTSCPGTGLWRQGQRQAWRKHLTIDSRFPGGRPEASVLLCATGVPASWPRMSSTGHEKQEKQRPGALSKPISEHAWTTLRAAIIMPQRCLSNDKPQ